MANFILNDILNETLSIEDVVNWLTQNDSENTKWINLIPYDCTQCEFVLYFVNFLRDQTKSTLQAYNSRETPAVVISKHASTNNTIDNKVERHDRVSLFSIPAKSVLESKKHVVPGIAKMEDARSMQSKIENQVSNLSRREIIHVPRNLDTLKQNSQFTTASVIGDSNLLSNSQNASKNDDDSTRMCSKIDTLQISSDSFHSSRREMTSTPVKKDKNCIDEITFRGFIEHDRSTSATTHTSNCNISGQHSPQSSPLQLATLSNTDINDYTDVNENIDTSNCLTRSNVHVLPLNTNNFPLNEKKDSNSSITSSIIHCSNDEWCNSNNSVASLRSRNINKNGSTLSNVSCDYTTPSLYINGLTKTPQNSKMLYSKSVERCQTSKNTSKQNLDATPKQGSHSFQKNAKSTPRYSTTLGDFMATDMRCSEKDSAKKNNARLQMSRGSDGGSSLANQLFVAKETFPEIGTSNGGWKRRIKPTKLNVSDDAACNINSTFGTISRPHIVNPRFSETLPTEKCDTTPFELERDLLRIEREKQRKGSVCEQQAELTSFQTTTKPLSRKILSAPTVIPSLDRVENIQALTTLARIYSTLLDFNLVLNPMTELYFVISLLTLQHSISSDNCQQSSNHSVTPQRDETNINEKSSEVIPIEQTDKKPMVSEYVSKTSSEIKYINEELGCSILNDDNEMTAHKDRRSPLQNFTEEVVIPSKLTEISCQNEEYDSVKNCKPPTQPAEAKNENRNYFQTIHDCIFFATKFLNMQRALLGVLNRATLKFLCENNRIATFLPELQEYLNTCYKLKSQDSSPKLQSNSFSAAEVNVSFQLDTDNKENFPSFNAFVTFRKQRDLFYELLRIWEAKHLVADWRFSNALAGKIQNLLTLHKDAANYSHFARLFKSQLLMSCIANGQQCEDSMEDESFSFLKSLKHLDPQKLTRLQERLISPPASKGPVPPPTFTGVQEFYRDFIQYASNPMFYAHLQDSLVHEIMELNDAQFTSSDIDDSETTVDEDTKRNFIVCISSLRLLAKFLGFLVSLPYKVEGDLVESVLTTQLELRSKVLPPLNLQYCLQNAIVSGKLALTIPWLVKYLAMLDPVSLRLPYYRTIFEMLFRVYCESSQNSVCDAPKSLPVMILIRFSVGWLFELSQFPLMLYLNWRMSRTHEKIGSVRNSSIISSQNVVALTEDLTNQLSQINKFSLRIDSLDLVDERILYACCPFLSELKTPLTTGNLNVTNNTSFRHITPVSSDLPKPYGSTSTKQLQMQLEDAFFHGQPISTRNTVSFVSERVASSCIKYIRNTILPRARSENVLAFQKIIPKTITPDNINNIKASMTVEIQAIAANLSSELQKQCQADATEMCKVRVIKSIEALLAEDTLDAVRETCVQITYRMATERIVHWIQLHISSGSLFVKDMEAEIDKINKNQSLLAVVEKKEHNANAPSPTNVIVDLRSIMWELLDNNGASLTLEKVLLSLDNAYESLTLRADLTPGPEKVISSMSVDLMLFLVAHRTDLFTSAVHDKLIRLWKIKNLNFSANDSVLSRILCPRNTMFLATPRDETLWTKLGQFLKKMLTEEVLSIDALSDQCTILLRYDWPSEILKQLSTCLSEAIKDFQSSNEESAKLKLLLEWIAETCNDMELIFDS